MQQDDIDKFAKVSIIYKMTSVADTGTCLLGWFNGSAPDCCPSVPGSNPASPRSTADCQSPGGLPPGIARGCGLTVKFPKMNRWFA
jgi:hypothetical protein